MNTQKLAEAIEHLEKAKELLFHRDMVQSRFDDVYHNAYMSIANHLKLLKNELHYAEKDKLATWRLSNKACTGLAVQGAPCKECGGVVFHSSNCPTLLASQ